jgi:hypothetical protein
MAKKQKMPAPFVAPRSNIKGIGKLGLSNQGLVPTTIDPKYGSVAVVYKSIVKKP